MKKPEVTEYLNKIKLHTSAWQLILAAQWS